MGIQKEEGKKGGGYSEEGRHLIFRGIVRGLKDTRNECEEKKAIPYEG